MSFSDIHIHILYGTDDGPKTPEEMFRMTDVAYENGVRLICATPHFYPAVFGDNRETSANAFSVLEEYCKEKYPDLKLFLGNELYYMRESISWLKNGVCRTTNGTRYVLVEFEVDSSEDVIAEGIDRLLNAGYIPIIAHAERYRRLSLGRLWALRQNGVLVQVNAQSFDNGLLMLGVRKRLKAMLDEEFIDFVSSDAHGLVHRVPKMNNAYEYLVKKYDENYAKKLCCNNAKMLFDNKSAEEK
ncbi:MAG: hypothetical protein IJC20_00390 [Clostridia bacterium]|nr:hypothetical protein [Clostridia bacterium]